MGLGGGFVALLMFGAMVTSGDTTSSSTSPTTTDQVEKTQPLPAPPAEDPAVELTLAQENAIDAAESCLEMTSKGRQGGRLLTCLIIVRAGGFLGFIEEPPAHFRPKPT